ncbi:hypothetical protein M378DRAFT_160851 [Amanita muscaria Koide BX008]|uniref:F-box domain-containing protein n=1 Tax=Amanita muscaria (strain Koide BX008) TaxID=946122 RepID=A0A0C2THJ6_AMAMK|nr:hypothetical protein M378DRAFT_160851 [Amanita muscaria Koide BX008]
MIGGSDEEGQVARGRLSSTNQVQRCVDETPLSENPANSYRWICIYAPSPIYRLSADVLRSIFELYCQVELHVTFPLRFSPPQFVLCQVCSAWRQIMLDNPAFWNKIRIAFNILTFKECTRYDKMIEVPRIWLSRAKDLPCFIDVDFFPFEPPQSSRLWKHDINKNIVRDLISPHNCKGLRVIFADYHLHDLLQLSDEKLSYIEVLHLHYVHDENHRETVSPLDLHKLSNLTSFSLIPNLSLFRFMERHGMPECQYFQVFSGIPWHQLRRIHLGVKLPALCCLNILETSSPVLEICSLVVWEDLSFASSPPSHIKPVNCPQLRELAVRIYPHIMLDDGDSFLLCLRLPKLKSLELRCPDNSEVSIDPRTLLRMQSVCSMCPEKLEICDRDCDVDAGALLASMPSLRCLEVPETSIFTVDAIREMGTGSIGPLLEELTIKNSKISNEIGELIQMVKMRSSIGKETSAWEKIMPTPFRSVLLSCEDLDEELLQKYDATINEINQSGVELTVNFMQC